MRCPWGNTSDVTRVAVLARPATFNWYLNAFESGSNFCLRYKFCLRINWNLKVFAFFRPQRFFFGSHLNLHLYSKLHITLVIYIFLTVRFKRKIVEFKVCFYPRFIYYKNLVTRYNTTNIRTNTLHFKAGEFFKLHRSVLHT